MLCHTQPEKKSANACTDGLGNRGGAGISLTEQSHKSKSGAPFPQYSRIESDGNTAFFVNEGRGWLIHCQDGVFQNPWTAKPFNKLCHAKKAIMFWFDHKKWPGRKKNLIAPEPLKIT